jgi:hypothetical protein
MYFKFRLIFTLALILSITFSSFAVRDISKGLRAGLLFSHYGGKDDNQAQTFTGFHAGGFFDIAIAKGWIFEPGLGIALKGSKLNYPKFFDIPTYGELTNRSLYLDIPLLLRYDYYMKFKGLGIFFGPQFSLLLSNHTRFRLNGGFNTDDTYEKFAKSDFGLIGGLSYRLKSQYFFRASYELGLNNLDPDDNHSINNRSIKIAVGYKFD